MTYLVEVTQQDPLKRNPDVLIAIGKIEDILKANGIPEICTACWKKQLPENKDNGGCCHGCSLLSPTGCTNKPLACAAWLCPYLTDRFPGVAVAIWDIAKEFPTVALKYREASLKAEAEL